MNLTEELALATRDPRLYTMQAFVIGKTYAPVDRLRNVIALKAAKAMGLEAEVLDLIKAAHREHLIWITLTQRKWQTNTSRRPQRSRNHDSWAIRESYVRADGSHYTDHLKYAHQKRAEHGL